MRPIADFVLAVVDSCQRIVGQDVLFHVGIHVLGEGDQFAVALRLVGLGLAALEDGLAALVAQRRFHGDLGVAEGDVVPHLALDDLRAALVYAVVKRIIRLHDEPDAAVIEIDALVADVLAPLDKAAAGVDELHLARAVHGLVFGDEPDVGGNAGIVEQIRRQLHDGLHQIAFNHIAADFAGTAARVAGEQAGTILNDGHAARAILQLLDAVEHEQHLSVADGGQAGAEAPVVALLGFLLHVGLFALPVDAEGRVGDDIVEGMPGELVVVQGVAVFHAAGVAALDEHVSLGDGIRLRVELLPEAGQVGVGRNVMQPLRQAAQHLAGAHRHVIGGLGAAALADVILFRGDQQLGHQVDDVARGEVRSGLLVIALGELADQLLKDIAHIRGSDALGAHIALRGGKLLQHHKEHLAADHRAHLIGKLEVLDNVLDVVGEALQVVVEVAFQIVRVAEQPAEGEAAGVVEAVTGGLAEDAIPRFAHNAARIQRLCHRNNLVLGGQQRVIKTLEHGHGQNHLPILVRLEQADQMGGNLPDEVGLFLYIGIRLLLQLANRHLRNLRMGVLFICPANES